MHPANRDWSNISYLASGNSKQRVVHTLLRQSNLLEHLAAYKPVVIGTIPIEMDTASSDIDIACAVYDIDAFCTLVKELLPDANVSRRDPVIVVRSQLGPFDLEIYGENRPVCEQRGYQHMMVEARLLAERGEVFRSQIMQLRAEGMKTEPAFATALGLKGDPYEALLELL